MNKKILIVLSLINLNAKIKEKDQDDKKIVNTNKYFTNQIMKNLKKEWEKFFKTHKNGHDLTNVDQIKIGSQKFQVHQLLGSPLSINKNIDYYLAQTSQKRLGFLFYSHGTIVRIQYQNNKVIKISQIPLKKSSPSIPIDRIIANLSKKIKDIKLEF